MKTIRISLVVVALIALSAYCAAFIKIKAAHNAQQIKTTEAAGFAVIELFTSEGCSSCPPADDLLGRIQQEYRDKPVYVLSYHVDYWDRMGWKDAFSDVKYSNRQYEYSQTLNSQVYTPQAVFNGQQGFIGSDATEVNKGLTKALSVADPKSLKIEARQQAGNLIFNYQYAGNATNSVLRLAVVQKHAVSKVRRGENEGRTLNHAQIVHRLLTFNSLSADPIKQQFELPVAFNNRDWEIIGMVQDKKSGAIHAATRAIFTNEPIGKSKKLELVLSHTAKFN